ncbi:hypothetical protein [Dictyobacter formicarum]|uniref:Peptidase C39-like domain-containing protein n=1 Tax=Dictyobacter formicarum TaxID=2778368 RepID=A0ABQ3V9A5_9CHLR|nr:hypothetical protein [Dictyobacter formicarum]GHO82253.1 hypothetical protein KSZ_02590 [Dictyobacter formicarum]
MDYLFDHHHGDQAYHDDIHSDDFPQSLDLDAAHQSFDPVHHDDGHHVLDSHAPSESIIGDLELGNPVEIHYPHFNPNYTGSMIIGDPGHDMAQWHQQEHKDTCAIVSQEFIIESLTGEHVSEDSLMHDALEHGWYIPHGGTPLDHVGDLLAYYGIPIERHEGATMTELSQVLNQGQKVIVGVNGEDIWYCDSPDSLLTHYPGMPGQNVDHAVEVIGIDYTDPLNPSVIINDPGIPDGQGIEVPEAVFEASWAISDHFMVSTTDTTTSAAASVGDSGRPTPLLGDAQSDKDWEEWNAKMEADKADWADWNAKMEADRADWAEWHAKNDI